MATAVDASADFSGDTMVHEDLSHFISRCCQPAGTTAVLTDVVRLIMVDCALRI